MSEVILNPPLSDTLHESRDEDDGLQGTVFTNCTQGLVSRGQSLSVYIYGRPSRKPTADGETDGGGVLLMSGRVETRHR